jgi:hypothetical protein
MTLGSIGIIDSRAKIIYHVGKAIAIVNDRIANPNQKAVTIETVCAVTSLTGFEVCKFAPTFLFMRADTAHYQLRTGSMTSVKIHLDGVEALVKSIGGLDALLSNPFTYKYTRWSVHYNIYKTPFSLFTRGQGGYCWCYCLGLKTTFRPRSLNSSSRLQEH